MTETEFEVAVVLVDTAHDLVIFRATRPASLTDIDCQLAEAMLGDEIYQIGMSVLYAPTAVEKVYVDRGVVSSTFVCPRGDIPWPVLLKIEAILVVDDSVSNLISQSDFLGLSLEMEMLQSQKEIRFQIYFSRHELSLFLLVPL